MLVQSKLSEMDMVVYRYVVPGSDDEFVQNVVYNNKITEAELKEWIAYFHGHYPEEIEIAR